MLTKWYITVLLVKWINSRDKSWNGNTIENYVQGEFSYNKASTFQDTSEWINSCCCCRIASVVSDSVRPHRRQPTRRTPWDSPGKNTGVGCHFLLQCMKVKRESEVAQSCPTLHDPMDCSLPGSSVHGICQARVLEWVAIAFFSELIERTPKRSYKENF